MQYDENAEKYGYEGEMTPLKCDELKPCTYDDMIDGDADINIEYYPKSDVDAAIAELKHTIDELVVVKKSAELILQNLLDCGLIKEWYFNGKFNAVLKADDPHLKIAELKKKLEDVQASAYADSVDAYFAEQLAEKDKEIALLKERICNGDVSRLTWIDDCIAKDEEIAELNKKLMPCLNGDCILTCEVVEKYGKENAELKSEIRRKEAVEQRWFEQCMEARSEAIRLKRALWLARAERAEARKNYWYARSCHEGDDFLVSIDGSPVKYIGCIKRTIYDWLLTWSEVESKCRAKAEEYK